MHLSDAVVPLHQMQSGEEKQMHHSLASIGTEIMNYLNLDETTGSISAR